VPSRLLVALATIAIGVFEHGVRRIARNVARTG
jgi:hypothetical protein